MIVCDLSRTPVRDQFWRLQEMFAEIYQRELQYPHVMRCHPDSAWRLGSLALPHVFIPPPLAAVINFSTGQPVAIEKRDGVPRDRLCLFVSDDPLPVGRVLFGVNTYE